MKPGEDTRIFVSDYFQESIMELAKQLQNDQSTRCFSFGRTTPLMKSCCGRNGLFGRQFGDSFTESSVKNVIYIGQSTDRLLQLLCLKFFVASSIYAFDPLSFEEIECMPIVRKLSTKRSHLIERAKEADIIGILIGTLSVRGYRDAIDFSRKLIKLAGKKSYTFVVGKINVAKLANFAEIDVSVVVFSRLNWTGIRVVLGFISYKKMSQITFINSRRQPFKRLLFRRTPFFIIQRIGSVLGYFF